MPYVQPSRPVVTGTLTEDDKPAILEALNAAGIDTSAIACAVTKSGNAFFILNVPRGRTSLIEDGDLLDQIADALDAAGWTMFARDGQRQPGGQVDVLARPTPRELWTIEEVARFLEVKATSARSQLSRWHLVANNYQRSGNGRPQGRYDAELVRVLAHTRPGRGARSDRL